MTLRSWIFWPHLVAGVTAGLVILLMSVTGVLLTYERQMIAWADSGFRSEVPSTGAAPLSVDVFLAQWQAEHPGVEPTAVTFGSAADAPVTVAVDRQTLFADAYTGRLLGESSQGMRTFMSRMRSWHRWIAVEGEGRTAARAVTGWSNLLFAFIVLSGMYLWLPRIWGWRQVKAVALFNGKARGKARDFNWHNVIGIWSAIPLFIVVVSAVPISFPWATGLVYRAVGEEPPAGRGGGRQAAPAARQSRGTAGDAGAEEPSARAGDAESPRQSLDDLLARAEGHVEGWRTINMRLPASDDAPVVFAIDRGDGGQPHLRSTLTLDRSTGGVLEYEVFTDQTLGRRIRSIMRFAHTGEVLGIPGQTIAGIVSAGGAVLVWTGLALAWRRFLAWRRRRAAAASAAGSPSTTAA